jgi:hypothetical protein
VRGASGLEPRGALVHQLWRAASTALLAVVATACAAAPAGASWHLQASFGRGGVAGLPLRESARGTLLAAGPNGSLYVGGYARHRPGAFLLARLSSRGHLIAGFGKGGVLTVPSVRWRGQSPPRLLAVPGGGLVVVGTNAKNELAVVQLTPSGRLSHSFGAGGALTRAFPHRAGLTIVTAATIESDGDLLVVYQREARQPTNEPAIPYGLGEGAIGLARVLPSGQPDTSFGQGGFLTAPGATPTLAGYPGTEAGWACEQSVAPDGTIVLAYEQAVSTRGSFAEGPAVLELTATGEDAPFSTQGTAFLPVQPATKASTSSLCEALFALGGGAVEAAFGGEGADSRHDYLFRFTPLGVSDTSFAARGYTVLSVPVAAMALGPQNEIFSAGTASNALMLGGTLASGEADPALGGSSGKGLAAKLPHASATDAGPTVELLAGAGTLTVRVGEEILRLAD